MPPFARRLCHLARHTNQMKRSLLPLSTHPTYLGIHVHPHPRHVCLQHLVLCSSYQPSVSFKSPIFINLQSCSLQCFLCLLKASHGATSPPSPPAFPLSTLSCIRQDSPSKPSSTTHHVPGKHTLETSFLDAHNVLLVTLIINPVRSTISPQQIKPTNISPWMQHTMHRYQLPRLPITDSNSALVQSTIPHYTS